MRKLISKNYVIACFSALILLMDFSACSEDNHPTGPNPNLPINKIKLISNKTVIEPFENIKITIEGDLDQLTDTYDDIVYHTNGVAYPPFGNQWRYEDNKANFRITDYKPGKYKTYASGYKEGILISQDSIEYEVIHPRGDFLSIFWQKSKNDEYFYYTTGRTPYNYISSQTSKLKIGGVSLWLLHTVENVKTEFIKFYFVPWGSELFDSYKTKALVIPDINNFDWHDQSDEGYEARCKIEYEFHHNYITELYGKSTLKFEGDFVYQTNLWEDYNLRFMNKLDNSFYPIEIWETSTSFICLARAGNSYPNARHPNQTSIVIAEPKKK